MNKKFDKHLVKVLKKMCSMVGANFEKINFKKEGWFRSYSWSEDKENKFKEWMIDYLKENKEARNSLMERPTSTKRSLEKVVDEFLFNYGWINDKIKNEKSKKKATSKGSKIEK